MMDTVPAHLQQAHVDVQLSMTPEWRAPCISLMLYVVPKRGLS